MHKNMLKNWYYFLTSCFSSLSLCLNHCEGREILTWCEFGRKVFV